MAAAEIKEIPEAQTGVQIAWAWTPAIGHNACRVDLPPSSPQAAGTPSPGAIDHRTPPATNAAAARQRCSAAAGAAVPVLLRARRDAPGGPPRRRVRGVPLRRLGARPRVEREPQCPILGRCSSGFDCYCEHADHGQPWQR